MRKTIVLHPIGIIHSPFSELENMPIQSVGAQSAEGKVVVDERYSEGLRDIEGFSHIYLVYHFHRANRTELRVIPYMDTVERGVFATRSPLRPSHVGISVVELLSVSGNVLEANNTPVASSANNTRNVRKRKPGRKPIKCKNLSTKVDFTTGER